MNNIERVRNYFLDTTRRNSYATPPDDQKFVDKVKRPRATSSDKKNINVGFKPSVLRGSGRLVSLKNDNDTHPVRSSDSNQIVNNQ